MAVQAILLIVLVIVIIIAIALTVKDFGVDLGVHATPSDLIMRNWQEPKT